MKSSYDVESADESKARGGPRRNACDDLGAILSSRSSLVAAMLLFVILLIGWPIVVIPAGNEAVQDLFGVAFTKTLGPGIQLKTPFAATHAFSLKTQVRLLRLHAWQLNDRDFTHYWEVRPCIPLGSACMAAAFVVCVCLQS